MNKNANENEKFFLAHPRSKNGHLLLQLQFQWLLLLLLLLPLLSAVHLASFEGALTQTGTLTIALPRGCEPDFSLSLSHSLETDTDTERQFVLRRLTLAQLIVVEVGLLPERKGTIRSNSAVWWEVVKNY